MKSLFFVFKTFVLTILLTFGAGMALLLASLQNQPLVSHSAVLSPQDIKRARTLLRRHNPKRQRAGQVRSLSLSEHELNLLANLAIFQRQGSSAAVRVAEGNMTAEVSIRVPRNPVGNYLNLSLGISESAGKPSVHQIRLGPMDLPNFMTSRIIPLALGYLLHTQGINIDNQALQVVRFQPQRLSLTYRWDPALMQEVRDRLVSPKEKQEIVLAYQQLTRALEGVNAGRLSMDELLGRMFQQIAKADPKDLKRANRAAIFVLAASINGRDLLSLLNIDTRMPKIKRIRITLRKRTDLAKHFIVSAALNVSGGGTLSALLGLQKELADAQGGSGFSFKDLAADMAGNRFAEVLTEQERSAARGLDLLAAQPREEAFMPQVDDLPENIQEREFTRRFGNTDSRAYRDLIDVISGRIARCPLYRR